MSILKNKFSIIIPSNRDTNIKSFLKAWAKEFKGYNVIVVEDNPTKTFDLPAWVEHYSWQEIDSELGEDSWIIPRRVAGIRSFGFLKAWQKKSEYILTFDDDCLPERNSKNFIKKIEKNLEKKWDSDYWFNTISEYKIYPRGYPYKIRDEKLETVIHHGLWSNIPDLDGLTQSKKPNFKTKPFSKLEKIPYGKFFSMCTMNLSFKRKAMPFLYLLLMNQDKDGKKWGYDRFDDIWAGIFAKRICDHLSWAISSGSPSVCHTRASNVLENIKKETVGIETNEWLWKKINPVKFSSQDPKECYLEIAEEIKDINPYFKNLSKAMKIWVGLLD